MTILVIVIGLILGSFYNVCIYRISKGESIIFPSSHCPKCNHLLKPIELIPILSYILLKGRCRYCDNKISPQYPIVELLTALIVFSLYCKYNLTGRFLAFSILASMLIITSFIDLDIQIIPNSLVAIGIVIGIVASFLGWTVDWIDAALGMLVGAGSLLSVGLLSLLVFRKEGMGGGDIKLMGMIGLFLGFKMTLVTLLITIYTGGFVSVLLLIFKKKNLGQSIPFGPFIGFGTMVTLIWGIEILSWYMKYLIGG